MRGSKEKPTTLPPPPAASAVLKKESSDVWVTTAPVLEYTEYTPLIVSTSCVGPAAPWVSGGMKPLWLNTPPVKLVPTLSDRRVRSSKPSTTGIQRRCAWRARLLRARTSERLVEFSVFHRHCIGVSPGCGRYPTVKDAGFGKRFTWPKIIE